MPQCTEDGDAVEMQFDVENIESFEAVEIIPADELMGCEVTQPTVNEGFGSYAEILDLAEKCAADAGFNYTFEETVTLYPNYPLAKVPVANTTTERRCGLLTLRFAEPRKVRTMDTVVNQIIQIAIPKGCRATDTLVKLFKGMDGAEASISNIATFEDEYSVDSDNAVEESKEKAIDPKDLVED